MKRVVVTGLGAVTPIGNNVADFWEGLKTGKNGIGMITRFDVSESKYKLAAEVKDFDPLCLSLIHICRKEFNIQHIFADALVSGAFGSTFPGDAASNMCQIISPHGIRCV